MRGNRQIIREINKGWFAFDKNKTVKEARDYENKKIDLLQTYGFKLFVIWDYEYKKDPQKTINRCLEFLNPD